MAKSRPLRTILIAGLVAGTFDITYACVSAYLRRGLKPIDVFHTVAAGALGRPAATAGGLKTAALGLGFHFLIALTAAAVYYVASRAIRFMIAHAVISGLVYGLCVYLFMYGIVLRFSALHVTRYPWSPPWSLVIGDVLIHTLGIGLSIALITRKLSR